MYKIVAGSTHDLPDTAAFIDLLNRGPESAPDNEAGFFDPQRELVVARAPGRLDLIGGIGDYSGSLVLELPIANATHVALQRQATPVLNLVSLPIGAGDHARRFAMPLADFLSAGRPIEYAGARERFESDGENHWAAYVAGAFLVLMREKGKAFNEGARILISSTVPEGKGVSSSAALEVATMQAVVAAYEVEVSPKELALLCQQVENLVAGAPCGVMDQMTAVCGETGRLLAILCQPGEVQGTVKLPAELEVWGIDSGIRHSVREDIYGTVRTAAFMGYRVIAAMAGLPCRETETAGVVWVDDKKWNGYLANITPEEFDLHYARQLPEQMSGAEFLKRYQGITDPMTSVKPERSYPVLASTRHPIYEHARVRMFAATLENWHGFNEAAVLGELMYQSDQSHSACGLGSEGTDELVSLVREAGAARGLFGAKITGGGNGGTVAVLGRRGAQDHVRAIADEYARRTGQRPALIIGSSPGAGVFGHLTLLKETTRSLQNRER